MIHSPVTRRYLEGLILPLKHCQMEEIILMML